MAYPHDDKLFQLYSEVDDEVLASNLAKIKCSLANLRNGHFLSCVSFPNGATGKTNNNDEIQPLIQMRRVIETIIQQRNKERLLLGDVVEKATDLAFAKVAFNLKHNCNPSVKKIEKPYAIPMAAADFVESYQKCSAEVLALAKRDLERRARVIPQFAFTPEEMDWWSRCYDAQLEAVAKVMKASNAVSKSFT